MSHHPKGKKQILLTEAAFVPSFHTNLVCIQKFNVKGVYWSNKERRLLEAKSRNGQLNEESLLKDQHLILNRRSSGTFWGVIIQKARCMRIGAHLPEELWPEAYPL